MAWKVTEVGRKYTKGEGSGEGGNLNSVRGFLNMKVK